MTGLNDVRLRAAIAVRDAVLVCQAYSTSLMAEGLPDTRERVLLSLALADLHMAADALAKAVSVANGESLPPVAPWPPQPQ